MKKIELVLNGMFVQVLLLFAHLRKLVVRFVSFPFLLIPRTRKTTDFLDGVIYRSKRTPPLETYRFNASLYFIVILGLNSIFLTFSLFDILNIKIPPTGIWFFVIFFFGVSIFATQYFVLRKDIYLDYLEQFESNGIPKLSKILFSMLLIIMPLLIIFNQFWLK